VKNLNKFLVWGTFRQRAINLQRSIWINYNYNDLLICDDTNNFLKRYNNNFTTNRIHNIHMFLFDKYYLPTLERIP
jgi:hypothetical protein